MLVGGFHQQFPCSFQKWCAFLLHLFGLSLVKRVLTPLISKSHLEIYILKLAYSRVLSTFILLSSSVFIL